MIGGDEMNEPEICPTCGQVTSIDKTDEFWKENHWLRSEKYRELADRRLELLKKLEWSGGEHDTLSQCPMCEGYEPLDEPIEKVEPLLKDIHIGHYPDCALARELGIQQEE